MTTIIMQDPEIYKQIGELTGRFNTFETNMNQQFQELKQTIREQSVVPYPVFEKHVIDTQKDINGLKDKVDVIEDTLKIRDATITGKLARFLDSAIVKMIGTALVGGVSLIVYVNYRAQIDNITQKLDNVSEQQHIERNITDGKD